MLHLMYHTFMDPQMANFIVSVRVEKSRNTSSQKSHDLDDRPSYSDQSRTHLNQIVIGGSSDAIGAVIADQSRSVIEDHNRWVDEQKLANPTESRRYQRWAKNSSPHLRGVITFGGDFSREAAKNTLNMKLLDREAARYVQEFCEKNGCEPTYLVRHMDETTPHYHWMTTGYNSNTHTPLRFNKSQLSALQDNAGEVFGRLNIHRGQKIAERLQNGCGNVIHKTVRQLHEDLPAEIAALETKKSVVVAGISAAKIRLAAVDEKIVRAENSASDKLNILQTRSENYEQRVQNKTAELEKIQRDIEQKQLVISNLDRSIYKQNVLARDLTAGNNAALEQRLSERTEERLFELVNRKKTEIQNQIVSDIKRLVVKNYATHMGMLMQKNGDAEKLFENKPQHDALCERAADEITNSIDFGF